MVKFWGFQIFGFELHKYFSLLTILDGANDFLESHPTVNLLMNAIIGLAILGGILTFLVVDALSNDEPERLISIAGVVGLLFLGFIGKSSLDSKFHR